MEKLIDSAVHFVRQFGLLQSSLSPNRFLLQFNVDTLRSPDGLLGAQQENRLQLGLVWGGIRLVITEGRLLKKFHKWLFSWRISVSQDKRMSTSHQCLQPAGEYPTVWDSSIFALMLELNFILTFTKGHSAWWCSPPHSCFLGVRAKKSNLSMGYYSAGLKFVCQSKFQLFVGYLLKSTPLIRIMDSLRLEKFSEIIKSDLQPKSPAFSWGFYCLLLSWRGKISRNTQIQLNFRRRLKGFWALQVSRKKTTNDETESCKQE